MPSSFRFFSRERGRPKNGVDICSKDDAPPRHPSPPRSVSLPRHYIKGMSGTLETCGDGFEKVRLGVANTRESNGEFKRHASCPVNIDDVLHVYPGPEPSDNAEHIKPAGPLELAPSTKLTGAEPAKPATPAANGGARRPVPRPAPRPRPLSGAGGASGVGGVGGVVTTEDSGSVEDASDKPPPPPAESSPFLGLGDRAGELIDTWTILAERGIRTRFSGLWRG